MLRIIVAAAIVMAGVAGYSRAMLAEDATQPIYVVSYIEIAPASVPEARKLLLGYVAEARKARDAVQIEALQRISDPGHFALIEQCWSPAAKQAFAATDPATRFRAVLGPLQSAGYDERIHGALSVGLAQPISGDPVFFLTHVDIIPTAVDSGTVEVKEFVERGRAAPGNRRFDDLVQLSRKNHFTVVESWDSQADKDAWISTEMARAFREELRQISGGLYDERAYKLLR